MTKTITFVITITVADNLLFENVFSLQNFLAYSYMLLDISGSIQSSVKDNNDFHITIVSYSMKIVYRLICLLKKTWNMKI